jgi:hypothetical protein
VRVALAAAPWLALLALAGCGDDDGSPETPGTPPAAEEARRLTAGERNLIARSERRIQGYCTDLALSVTGQRKPPLAADRARAFTAVDDLVELASEKPAAQVEPGVDLRLHVGDIAENLQGSNCDREIITALDEGLARIPPP